MSHLNEFEKVVADTLTDVKEYYINNREVLGIKDSFGYFTDHPFAKINQWRLREIVKFSNGKNIKGLDLACGGGVFLKSWEKMGIKAVGIDYSSGEVELARKFLKNGKNVWVLNEDLLKEDWKKKVEKKLEGRPNLILLAYALHHLPNVDNFIKKLGLWLGDDWRGKIIVNEEEKNNLLFRVKNLLRWWMQHDTDGEKQRSFKDWEKMFLKYGFVCREVRSFWWTKVWIVSRRKSGR